MVSSLISMTIGGSSHPVMPPSRGLNSCCRAHSWAVSGLGYLVSVLVAPSNAQMVRSSPHLTTLLCQCFV